jgi:hypothetical protein
MMAHISCNFLRMRRKISRLLPEWRYERFIALLFQFLVCKRSVKLKLAKWYSIGNNQHCLLLTCVLRLSVYLVIRTFICIPSKFQIHVTTQQCFNYFNSTLLFESVLLWTRKGGDLCNGFPNEILSVVALWLWKVQSLYIRGLWVKIRNPLNQQLGNANRIIFYSSSILLLKLSLVYKCCETDIVMHNSKLMDKFRKSYVYRYIIHGFTVNGLRLYRVYQKECNSGMKRDMTMLVLAV